MNSLEKVSEGEFNNELHRVGGIIDELVSICGHTDRERELDTAPFSKMQHNFCNESGPDTDADNASEETIMPPPAPYYVRRPQLLGPQKSSQTDYSATSTRESRAEDLLASKRSLSNLDFARSQHNRRIGSAPEFRADAQQKSRLRLRAAEFDALLAHL